MNRETILGAAHMSRVESPSATEYRFEFREDNCGRIYTVIMTGEQLAAVLTSRVTSDVTMHIRNREVRRG